MNIIYILLAICANYFIIRKIRLDKKRLKQLKALEDLIERQNKIRKILLLSLGLNGLLLSLSLKECIHFSIRGGSEFTNVEYIREKCNIAKGVRYLDDNRLRNIIHDLYRHKKKARIIYITATALYHLSDQYGQ